MKLVRYGASQLERPGVLDQSGRIRDLSGIVSDIDGSSLSLDSLKRLQEVETQDLPLAEEGTRLGPCVGSVGKFICVGLNYSDHAKESGMAVPKEPVIFMKATSAISGPYDDVELPEGSSKSDWEVELGVVIGTLLSG